MPKGDSKKYYFVKLPETFFDDKKIRFLQSQENGDRVVILYLKMILHSLRNAGAFYFDEMMDTIEEEIALQIGANPEEIKRAVDLCIRAKLLTKHDGEEDFSISIPNITDILLTETDDARRKRLQRERDRMDQEPETGNPFQEDLDDT